VLDKDLTSYIDLINRFLDGTIDALTFERDFFRTFKNEDTLFGEEVFQIMDRFFADVDAFCADDTLRDDNDLDEEGLRKSCRHALARLSDLGYSQDNKG
jgi:hypothetical protein